MIRLLIFFLLIASSSSKVIAAVNPILRVSLEKGNVTETIDIRLFDDVAPATVANFLNYANSTTVNGGSYIDSFFHRNFDGLFFQGGGFYFDHSIGAFTYNNLTGQYDGGLQQIIDDGAIANEFSLSNTRRTIAMAKKAAQYVNASGDPVFCVTEGPDCILIEGTGPDSATSQWFINLADNASILDGQNGGFTVFGEVTAESMLVVDNLALSSTYDFSEIPGFGYLPLVDYTEGAEIQENNLIKIISMQELFRISSDVDFGDKVIGTVTDATITIETLVDKELVLGDIAKTDPLGAPFSIINNDCNNRTLDPNTSCDIMVRYQPVSLHTIVDTFDIELEALGVSYAHRVTASNAQDISLNATVFDFGEITPYNPEDGLPEQRVIIIENVGVKELEISSHELVFSAGNVSDFEIIDNCETLGTLTPKSSGIGYACAIPVNFIGTTPGDFSFVLTVISNDPDQPRIDITFTGTVVLDTDGVPHFIEDAAPNNGDGNFDGIPDSRQSHVVSMPNAAGDYITLISDSTTKFTKVTFVSPLDHMIPYLSGELADIVISYKIPGLIEGGAVRVGIYIPDGYQFDDYLELVFDEGTSSEKWSSIEIADSENIAILRNAEIVKQDSSKVRRDLITASYTDGAYADTDDMENGEINVTGLILMKKKTSDASGNIHASVVLLLFMSAVFLRKHTNG